jgi:glycosyltransferase involved in cell wall biosynthesis
MRIGIVPELNPNWGGRYQYSLTLLDALGEGARERVKDEFTIFTPDKPQGGFAARFAAAGWQTRPLRPPGKPRARDVVRRLAGDGRAWEAIRWIWRAWQRSPIDLDQTTLDRETSEWFRSLGVELMLYPNATPLAFEADVPCVMAIHDLQHRLQPEFPEVSADGEWELREHLFRNAARRAKLLLADSEVGKEDILHFYGPFGARPEQIKVLPFVSASYLSAHVPEAERSRIRARYALPERYLFYPAQFWPHKNHARLVHALGALKHKAEIPLVLCGSHSGSLRERTWREVMSLARSLDVEKQVLDLGFVPDEDMSALYARAAVLVMPTFFGPTNIPVLEAWAFDCPVLSSDIRGIREQIGDAGLLADPRSSEAIADGIYRLWSDENLRRTVSERGRARLRAYTHEDFRRRVLDIVAEAAALVQSEKSRMGA